MGIDPAKIHEEYQRRMNFSIETFVPEPEKLTAIVITKNEERNISRCLSSLSFADEIIVVDSGSTDKTVEIARSFPNTTVIQTVWLGFVENKKIAIKHAKNNWIFWIDADEEAPPELAQEWKTRIAGTPFHDAGGIDVGRKTFFLNHWVKHSGWYPCRVIRFFHKNRAFFNENILHEGVLIQEGYFPESFQTDLLHYSYTSLYQYFDKMNRYGLLGAQELIRKKKRTFLPALIFQPIWTFLRFYILKKGFLDGRIGLIICLGAAFSNFIKYANYFFLKKFGYVDVYSQENPQEKK